MISIRLETLLRNSLTRRQFGQGGMALGATFAASPAFALTEERARRLVEAVVADIFRVINSGRAEASMLREFERIFTRYADVDLIARRTLGPDGRSASNSQISAYVSAFRGYISRKYGRRFREFIGGSVEVTDAYAEKSYFVVRTRTQLQGQAPFEVRFLVLTRNGQDKFFNLLIEGVNLMLAERTEIGAMLDKRRGNLDQLIADLRTFG